MVRLVVMLICLLGASTALATQGSSGETEILGFDRIDGKLFVLLRGYGEGGSGPRLAFLSLRDADPERVRIARSWQAMDPNGQTFADRLARLRNRLDPVKRMDLAGVRTSQRRGELAICRGYLTARTPAERRAALEAYLKDDRDGSDEIRVCRPIDVRVDWRGWSGGARIETEGGLRGPGYRRPMQLRGIFTVPDAPVALALIRYVGRHYEGGYMLDRLVVLRKGQEAAQ